MHETQQLWADDLVHYPMDLRGAATLSERFDHGALHPRREPKGDFRATIRRTIYEHSSERLRSGRTVLKN